MRKPVKDLIDAIPLITYSDLRVLAHHFANNFSEDQYRDFGDIPDEEIDRMARAFLWAIEAAVEDPDLE